MKKMVFAMATALMMSMGIMAQDGQTGATRPERKQLNQEELVQQRTQRVVEQYKLNETQAQQLLELNKKYGAQLGRPGGRRPDMRQGRPRGRGELNRDSVRAKRPLQKDSLKVQAPDDVRKQLEAYDAELQKILTEEQYKAYKADQAKRFRPQGQRQQRQHRNNNDK